MNAKRRASFWNKWLYAGSFVLRQPVPQGFDAEPRMPQRRHILFETATAQDGEDAAAYRVSTGVGRDSATIFDFLAKKGLRKPVLTPITSAEYPTRAQRPANSRLNCAKLARVHGIELPPWRDSLGICLERLTGDSGT